MAPSIAAAGDAQPTREGRQPQAASYLSRGLAMLARPRPEDQAEAERLLRKALDADPQLAEAHIGLSRMSVYLYTMGLDETPQRLETSRSEAARALQMEPENPRADAALAMALAASDRLTPALEAARQSVVHGPTAWEGHLALCTVQRLRRDLDDALAACRRAAELNPDESRVLIGLAEILRERGDYASARDLFGQAADLDHASALPQLGAAATLQKQGSVNWAERAYNLILEKYSFARVRALQGEASMRVAAGDYLGALDLYEGVELKDNASLPTILSLYGKGYALLQLARAAEAEYFLSTLIERVPLDYDGPARGRDILFLAYDDLIRYFEARGRTQKADALLAEAAARPQAPLRTVRRQAERLQARHEDTAAASLLERAIPEAGRSEDPIEISEAALLLARLRSAGGQKTVAAASPAGRAMRAADDRVAADAPGAAHYRMARAFALARDADQSLACLRRARANGYLPSEQASTESDFAYLRARPEFQALLTP